MITENRNYEQNLQKIGFSNAHVVGWHACLLLKKACAQKDNTIINSPLATKMKYSILAVLISASAVLNVSSTPVYRPGPSAPAFPSSPSACSDCASSARERLGPIASMTSAQLRSAPSSCRECASVKPSLSAAGGILVDDEDSAATNDSSPPCADELPGPIASMTSAQPRSAPSSGRECTSVKPSLSAGGGSGPVNEPLSNYSDSSNDSLPVLSLLHSISNKLETVSTKVDRIETEQQKMKTEQQKIMTEQQKLNEKLVEIEAEQQKTNSKLDVIDEKVVWSMDSSVEQHRFQGEIIEQTTPAIFNDTHGTIFCLEIEGLGAFLFSAAHGWNGKNVTQHTISDIDITVLSYESLFPESGHQPGLKCMLAGTFPTIRIGDLLVANGFDQEVYKGEQRMWQGELQTLFACPNATHHTCLSVGGMQVCGMSGSPVFNGCGLVGIAVKAQFGKYNLTNGETLSFTNTIVYPISALRALIESPGAEQFKLTPNQIHSYLEIPRKLYCSHPRYK